MAFQIDEKLLAANRAIITRNKTEKDLIRDDIAKFKPGMIHYIEDNDKLLLSIAPEKIYENGEPKVRAFTEILTNIAVKDYPIILMQKEQPTELQARKDNTFWYEIVGYEGEESDAQVLVTEAEFRILTGDYKYLVPDVNKTAKNLATIDGEKLMSIEGDYLTI